MRVSRDYSETTSYKTAAHLLGYMSVWYHVLKHEHLVANQHSRISYTEVVHNPLQKKYKSQDNLRDTQSVASEQKRKYTDEFTRDLQRRLSDHQYQYQHQILQPYPHPKNIRSKEITTSLNLKDSERGPDVVVSSSIPDASVGISWVYQWAHHTLPPRARRDVYPQTHVPQVMWIRKGYQTRTHMYPGGLKTRIFTKELYQSSTLQPTSLPLISEWVSCVGDQRVRIYIWLI